MDEIKRIFEQLAGPLPAWPEIEPDIRFLTVSSGAEVVRLDLPSPYIFVVLDGLLKLHHVGGDGRERIKSFATVGGVVASISALQNGGVASFSITALEPSTLARLPYGSLENMADKHITWGRLLRGVLINYALQKELREQAFLMKSAAMRYEDMILAQPDLAGRIAQQDMAAYLGVTPVGLSRIIGRIKRKNGVD